MELTKLTIPKLHLNSLCPNTVCMSGERRGKGTVTIYECSDGLAYECSGERLYAVKLPKGYSVYRLSGGGAYEDTQGEVYYAKND